jgi:hypothetical protein
LSLAKQGQNKEKKYQKFSLFLHFFFFFRRYSCYNDGSRGTQCFTPLKAACNSFSRTFASLVTKLTKLDQLLVLIVTERLYLARDSSQSLTRGKEDIMGLIKLNNGRLIDKKCNHMCSECRDFDCIYNFTLPAECYFLSLTGGSTDVHLDGAEAEAMIAKMEAENSVA